MRCTLVLYTFISLNQPALLTRFKKSFAGASGEEFGDFRYIAPVGQRQDQLLPETVLDTRLFPWTGPGRKQPFM